MTVKMQPAHLVWRKDVLAHVIDHAVALAPNDALARRLEYVNSMDYSLAAVHRRGHSHTLEPIFHRTTPSIFSNRPFFRRGGRKGVD